MAKAKKKEPKKAARKPRPKPRQQIMPGTDSDRIKELDETAATYREARDVRMKCTKEEVDAKEKLHEMMRKHKDELPKNDEGETVYRLIDADPPEEVALVVEEETVKVRKVKKPPAAQDPGDNENAATVDQDSD